MLLPIFTRGMCDLLPRDSTPASSAGLVEKLRAKQLRGAEIVFRNVDAAQHVAVDHAHDFGDRRERRANVIDPFPGSAPGPRRRAVPPSSCRAGVKSTIARSAKMVPLVRSIFARIRRGRLTGRSRRRRAPPAPSPSPARLRRPSATRRANRLRRARVPAPCRRGTPPRGRECDSPPRARPRIAAGLRLCGIVEEPPPRSATSATSCCIRSETSRATLPSVAT